MAYRKVAKLPRGSNHTFKSKPVTMFGCKFRSQLEARWAMVFTELGVPWQYEPRPFRTEQGGYLPDFLVGKVRPFWLEIKGPEPTQRDYVRAAHVARVTGQKFRFLVGSLPVAPTHGLLRTRVLQVRTWRPADWHTPYGARPLDAAVTKALAHRFDSLC